jgi:membrane protease subunit (stomatin/prohibitin family)
MSGVNKCVKCNERPRVGYKYCAECRVVAEKDHSGRRRRNSIKMCDECGVTETRTKYCRSCAQTVKLKQNKERITQSRVNETGMCMECKYVPARTKYCKDCAKEVNLRQNRDRATSKRIKTPCAKCGMVETATKYCKSCSQPTRGSNKPQSVINEKFLVRGHISGTGSKGQFGG